MFRVKEPHQPTSKSEEDPSSPGATKDPHPVCHPRGWPPIPGHCFKFRLILAMHLSPKQRAQVPAASPLLAQMTRRQVETWGEAL